MKSSYSIKTTNGDTVSYSYAEIADVCRQYLKNQGNVLPTKQDVDAEIPDFVNRFKLVVNKKENGEENAEE